MKNCIVKIKKIKNTILPEHKKIKTEFYQSKKYKNTILPEQKFW